jgi:hypothetical protein
MFRGGFLLSHKTVNATVSTENLFHSNLYTIQKFAPFSYICFAELLRKLLPVYKFLAPGANQSTNFNQVPHWASFIHGGLYSRWLAKMQNFATMELMKHIHEHQLIYSTLYGHSTLPPFYSRDKTCTSTDKN